MTLAVFCGSLLLVNSLTTLFCSFAKAFIIGVFGDTAFLALPLCRVTPAYGDFSEDMTPFGTEAKVDAVACNKTEEVTGHWCTEVVATFTKEIPLWLASPEFSEL